MFPLCNKCALEKLSRCPNHNDIERSFTGTFCTPEVQHALRMGYKLLKIYEIWQYESSEQYNPETKKDGIFTEYINMFLAVKQESSGYPSFVNILVHGKISCILNCTKGVAYQSGFMSSSCLLPSIVVGFVAYLVCMKFMGFD